MCICFNYPYHTILALNKSILRSTGYTAEKRIFAVCPVVFHVLSIGHTAKKLLAVCTHDKNITHGKVMLCRVLFFCTRQRHVLPCVLFRHKIK